MAASDRTTETCSACSRLVDIVLSDGGLRIKVGADATAHQAANQRPAQSAFGFVVFCEKPAQTRAGNRAGRRAVFGAVIGILNAGRGALAPCKPKARD